MRDERVFIAIQTGSTGKRHVLLGATFQDSYETEYKAAGSWEDLGYPDIFAPLNASCEGKPTQARADLLICLNSVRHCIVLPRVIWIDMSH